MPKLVDLGAHYGTVAFPDEYSPQQILAEYEGLEAARKSTPTPRLADLNAPTAGDYARQVGGKFIRGIGGVVASIPESLAIASSGLARLTGVEVPIAGEGDPTNAQERYSYKLGQAIRRGAEAIAPTTRKDLDESFMASKLPEGVGSALGFMAGGLAGRALKIPQWLGVAGLGSASGGSEFYQDAKASGADEGTAQLAAVVGNVVGTSEAVPLSRMMRRLDGVTGGTFSRFVWEAGKDTIEEALQEGAQRLAQNVTAQQLYDKDRELFQDVVGNAGVGGATGFLLSAVTQALGIPIGRSRVRRQSEDESRDRIRRVIEQRERETDAESAQIKTEAPGQEAAAGQEEVGGVRVRLPTENRLETQTGTEVTNVSTPISVPPATSQTTEALPPPAEGVRSELQPVATDSQAPMGRSQIGMADTAAPPTAAAGIPGVQPSPQRAIVEQAIAGVSGRWENAPEFSVVEDPGQLPADVQSDVPAGLNLETTPGVTDRAGRVWLVARNIADPAHATRVIMEEAVGHVGVESALGASFDDFMRGVAVRHAATPIGREVRRAYGEDPITVGREIVAKLAQDPAADPTLWQRIVATVRQWVRNVFDITVSDNDVQVLLSRARRVVESGTARPVAQPAARFAAPQEPPPIEGLQVAGASAQVGRIAEEIYGAREAGGQALEGLSYERRQFKMARAELKRLAEIAYGRFGAAAQDEEPVVFPDPSEGVGITDGQITVDITFVDTLNAVDVPHSPETVQAMQAELFFEGAARRLNNLLAQIETLTRARQYYTDLDVAPSEIAKIDTALASLQTKEEELGAAEHNGETVSGRASEMRAAAEIRPERMAQRDALSLEPVAEFFGRQVGGFRDFVQRADAARRLAEVLRDGKTNISEWMRLNEDVERWLRLPADVQAAIRSGLPLTDEQRASAFATLAQVFDDFDLTRARMNEIVAARLPLIDREERALLDKMANQKITSGMAQVMVADVLAALDGESGGTGTLQSQAVTQELRQRFSAIQSFALNVGENLEMNRAMFEWLANPTTPPVVPVGASYGVDQQTLAMILDEVRRNPAFGSAIVTLVAASQKKLANLPAVQLEEIQALVAAGNMKEARALANRLMGRANSRASVAESSLREGLRAVDALNIERMALENGVAMFDELAASPEFTDLRNTVANSPFGLVEPMVAQNNNATTFKPFGANGIPSHTGLVMGVSDNPVLKSEWFHRADQWHLAAQHHLDAYDAAQALYNADPLNNPQPSALGFDLAKVRGLRDAVQRFVPGSFLEISLLSENRRWKIPRLVREMSKTAWFRQHDIVTKMVGGITGTDLRGRLADFVNHFLIARSTIQQYNDIPARLHAAMKSHPNVQMNMANYREIWNELAHWGRLFGSPVRIGFVLPRSGAVVTAEDLSLLQRQRKFEEELRRKVTETNPTAGIRLQSGGRELVRAGAYVGDEGLPRHLNRQADSFIADVVEAYGEQPLTFDATTDLSASSNHPVVRFWNAHIPQLIQHVLDVRRGDRAMRLDPTMQAVELATETEWRSVGVSPIHSVEDLVNALVTNAPPMPGWNVRDRIIAGLNSELRQYRDASQRIATERAEREQARNSGVVIAFSAENEFTRPAAKLELPSAFYDYGALTPGEHLTITSRANHERVVAYATAVQRATSELQSRLARFRNGEITEAQAASSYGGNLDEMKQVIGLLGKIAADFEAAYRTGNPATTQSQWYREGFGLLTSAVLALPTVGLRNMTQGQFETYVMSRAMGLAGHRLTMWRALLTAVKTVGRFATDLGLGIIRKTDVGASFLTGKDVQLFSKLADQIASLVLTPNYLAGADRVHQLGYDTREDFIERLKRIWEETAETATREDTSAVKINVRGQQRRVAGLAGVPVKSLRAFLDAVGVQQYDQAINASLLQYATWLQKRLEEVALTYGAERTRQGLTAFSSTDPRWQLQPDEFGAFKSEQQNKDALGLFRLFLELSASSEGFQLERNMWAFYQAHQAGQHPRLFTERQFDAVQRRLLAEFNASTPANRASAAAGNNVIRNLLTLQGYVSDGLLKLINLVAGGSRDRTVLAATLGKLPTVAALSLMAVLIGYMAGGLTGEWEKRLRGRAPTLPTPFDRDFWTSWKRWYEGTLRLGAAQLFYIGDIILAMRGEVQGNRGFDPVGRVFPISIVQRALASMRGVWNTAKGSGTLGDSLVPLADFGRSMTPFWLEVQNAFGASQGAIKQGERIIRGEAHVQGLISDSRMASGGPTYGPNTIVRRNVGEAVSAYWKAQQAGDTPGAEAALVQARAELKKLEDFYVAKYLKAGDSESVAITKARRDVWGDYQEINPVVSAMQGKRPTEAQYALIRGGMSGERAGVVDSAVQAWQAGATALFGRPGNITREDVADARTGSGGAIPSRAISLSGGPLRRRTGIRGLTPISSGVRGTRRRRTLGVRGTRRRRTTTRISRRRLGPRIGGRTRTTRRRRAYSSLA